MTIGFDASRAFVENRTGTENYSFHLLQAISKIDIENDYLVYIRKGQSSNVKAQNWPENFQFKIISYKYLWTQLGLALRTFIDPLDVLFVPAHTLPLIRKPGLKTVITVHDLGAEYLPGFHQLKQILYLKLMTYYQLKSATKIIAVSEATKKDLVKKTGIKSEKIRVVYEGINKETFSPPAGRAGSQLSAVSKIATSNILRRYDIERERYFLFVGTIQPRKNLERLIKAFASFARGPAATESLGPSSVVSSPYSDFKLILVGSKGWKSENIYSLPKRLSIKDKVVFAGRVSDQDLAVLYSEASALTYPSLFEGFGLPILEAFACKCPVITSNISSMPEIAGGAALLINPENEEEIYKALVKITEDDILRKSLIQKGLDRLKKFNWEKSALETVKIITEAGEQK